eukprot:2774084-Karenia_brevis.AAC.1
MKVEALWSHHDIAIAQATSACRKWEVSEHHRLQTSGGPMEGEKFEQLSASPFQHWPACVWCEKPTRLTCAHPCELPVCGKCSDMSRRCMYHYRREAK